MIRTSSVGYFQMASSVTLPVASKVTDRVGASVLDLVGRTPLVRLQRFEPEPPVSSSTPRPSGRIRAGRSRIGRGPHGSRRRGLGRADAGSRDLDATSGNTGIAYAMVGASRGYQVTLCLPDNASPERKQILRALGAELVLTDPLAGTDGAIREARRRSPRNRRSTSIPTSPATTAIGKPTTVRRVPRSGSRRAGDDPFRDGARNERDLRGYRPADSASNPAMRLVSLEPVRPFHGLEGMKHMESAMVPAIYDPVARRRGPAGGQRARVRDGAAARARGGLLVGISSGAKVAVMMDRGAAHGTRGHRDGILRRRGEVPH